jgi:hypothetical protein
MNKKDSSLQILTFCTCQIAFRDMPLPAFVRSTSQFRCFLGAKKSVEHCGWIGSLLSLRRKLTWDGKARSAGSSLLHLPERQDCSVVKIFAFYSCQNVRMHKKECWLQISTFYTCQIAFRELHLAAQRRSTSQFRCFCSAKKTDEHCGWIGSIPSLRRRLTWDGNTQSTKEPLFALARLTELQVG